MLLVEDIWRGSYLSQSENDYRLLMVLVSLSTIKAKILLTLSHLYPQRVNGLQLTQLLGYKKKSRILYRGILKELEDEGLIEKINISSKEYSIQINTENALMKSLIELSISYGDEYSDDLYNFLEEIYL